jgi:hypothetical protein
VVWNNNVKLRTPVADVGFSHGGGIKYFHTYVYKLYSTKFIKQDLIFLITVPLHQLLHQVLLVLLSYEQTTW